MRTATAVACSAPPWPRLNALTAPRVVRPYGTPSAAANPSPSVFRRATRNATCRFLTPIFLPNGSPRRCACSSSTTSRPTTPPTWRGNCATARRRPPGSLTSDDVRSTVTAGASESPWRASSLGDVALQGRRAAFWCSRRGRSAGPGALASAVSVLRTPARHCSARGRGSPRSRCPRRSFNRCSVWSWSSTLWLRGANASSPRHHHCRQRSISCRRCRDVPRDRWARATGRPSSTTSPSHGHSVRPAIPDGGGLRRRGRVVPNVFDRNTSPCRVHTVALVCVRRNFGHGRGRLRAVATHVGAAIALARGRRTRHRWLAAAATVVLAGTRRRRSRWWPSSTIDRDRSGRRSHTRSRSLRPRL